MTTATQSIIADLDRALNQAIVSGDFVEAFQRYYADSVVMQENQEAPTVGKAANHKRETEFIDSVKAFHSSKLLNSAVAGNTSLSEWEMDIEFKNGVRFLMRQVSVREWENGQIINERFYYNKG